MTNNKTEAKNIHSNRSTVGENKRIKEVKMEAVQARLIFVL